MAEGALRACRRHTLAGPTLTFLTAIVGVTSFFFLPSSVLAGTYGNGPYDAGVYGTGYVAPVSSGGGGGSGGSLFPVAPVLGNGTTVFATGAATATFSGPATTSAQSTTTPAGAPGIAASPTPAASENFTFSRNLAFGIRGEDVRQLQLYLNTKGFLVASSGRGSPGNETDYFGPATQVALASFQRANGITTDTGYFGPLTRTLIAGYASTAKSALPPAAPEGFSFTRGLALNMQGEDVRALQQYLNAAGFLLAISGAGSPDHETLLFGLRTYRALVRFQAAHGLPATGYFGPLTRALIQ